MQVRKALLDDRDFLWPMLVEACNWMGEQRITRGEVETHAHLSHYVAGWPRAGDFGQIAIDGDGVPVGAAWARRFPAQHPGYGFVDEQILEISMAVVTAQRGRGIGNQLLRALIDDAREAACRAVSLSVEEGNRATRLYRAAGFVTVDRVGHSATMLLELCG